MRRAHNVFLHGRAQVREKKARKVLGHVLINLAPYSDVSRASKKETFELTIDSTKIATGTPAWLCIVWARRAISP